MERKISILIASIIGILLVILLIKSCEHSPIQDYNDFVKEKTEKKIKSLQERIKKDSLHREQLLIFSKSQYKTIDSLKKQNAEIEKRYKMKRLIVKYDSVSVNEFVNSCDSLHNSDKEIIIKQSQIIDSLINSNSICDSIISDKSGIETELQAQKSYFENKANATEAENAELKKENKRQKRFLRFIGGAVAAAAVLVNTVIVLNELKKQ